MFSPAILLVATHWSPVIGVDAVKSMTVFIIIFDKRTFPNFHVLESENKFKRLLCNKELNTRTDIKVNYFVIFRL